MSNGLAQISQHSSGTDTVVSGCRRRFNSPLGSCPADFACILSNGLCRFIDGFRYYYLKEVLYHAVEHSVLQVVARRYENALTALDKM